MNIEVNNGWLKVQRESGATAERILCSESAGFNGPIHYFHMKPGDILPAGFRKVSYTWMHKPTGRTGVSTIALMNGKVEDLIARWNGMKHESTTWFYELVEGGIQ